MTYRRALRISVALGALFATGLAHAADTTIVSGQTVTDRQTLSAAGDTLTIESGGVLDVGGGVAVEASASGVTITNEGSVTGWTSAINLGDGNTLANSGTLNGGIYSVVSARSLNSIVNSGTITDDYDGIYVSGTGNDIDNEGSIDAGVAGISLDDGSNSITNSGSIEGGTFGIVVNNTSFGNTIANTGSIVGATATAVALYGTGNDFTNAGYVYGGAYGIRSTARNVIANSGTVESAGVGIRLEGGDTLTNSGVVSALSDGVSVGGNSSTIENAGSIFGGGNGLVIEGGFNTLENTGLIQGNTSSGYGLEVTGIQNDVNNSGTIDGFYGVSMHYSGNTLTNSGTISGDFFAIDASDSNVIVNAGLVSSLNNGIRVCGSNNVVNSGTISAAGEAIRGCNNETITNSGTITTGTYGIRLLEDGSAVTNTGDIGGGTVGIEAVGDNNTISNSGGLSGTTYAVSFQGTGNRLDILKGSRIEGTLAMGTGNSVSIEKGLNVAFAYTGSPTVTSGNDFLIVTGTELVTLDTTGFSAEDDQLDNLTRAINDTIDRRLAATRQSGGDYAQVSGGMQVRPVADASLGDDGAFWMSGFGGYQNEDSDRQTMGWDSLLGGGTLGFDQVVSDNLRLGGLVGFAASRFSSDGSEEITTTSYFLGGYAGYDMGRIFVDATLFGGLSDFAQERNVLDNTITGGSETVETNHDGWFINPSLTLGAPMEAAYGTFTPSVRARYAAVALDDYTEQWNAIDVSFARRVLSLFDLRGQLAYDLEHGIEGSNFGLGLRGGVDVTFANADDVEAQAASTGLHFSAGDDGTSWRGFAGLDLSYATDAQARFFIGTEVGWASGESLSAEGRAGLELKL